MDFLGNVFFQIGLGVVTIVTTYDRRNRDMRVNKFAVTALATRNMSETGLPQVIDKLSDLPWHTPKKAQSTIIHKT